MAHPLSVERSRAIPVNREEAFDRTLPMPLPTLFRTWYGPIPPIKEVRDQRGDWRSVGETRTIALAGGGTMRETLTEVDPGHVATYVPPARRATDQRPDKHRLGPTRHQGNGRVAADRVLHHVPAGNELIIREPGSRGFDGGVPGGVEFGGGEPGDFEFGGTEQGRRSG